MSRRSSSVNRTDSGISRNIGKDIAKVRTVADNIDAVIAAAGVDLATLADTLKQATDFTGISVAAGESASWDPVTKTLVVPTIKGVKGDKGDPLKITSVTPTAGGTFLWVFSDGTEYTTPPMKGDKGDTGSPGDKGDSVSLSGIEYRGEGKFLWTFTDGTTYLTPDLRGGTGLQGDKGDKGDKGDPLELLSVMHQGGGEFLWRFSDGTDYITPDLRGPRGAVGDKGDKGDQGVSIHHIAGTSTTDPEGDFASFGETDTYTIYGDKHETQVLGWFTMRNGVDAYEHREQAREAAALAKRWASEDQGTEIENGKFSAMHYAFEVFDRIATAESLTARSEAAADRADASAGAALVSEAAAKASEDFASIKAAEAVMSASEALQSEGAAKTSELAALSSENKAKTSENKSKASELAALASEVASKTSELNADNHRSAAAVSATQADASKIAAEAARDSTAALVQQFGDHYLGDFTADPTLDNSGNPLTSGDIYLNTNDNVLKFYTGTQWVAPEVVASTAATLAEQKAAEALSSAQAALDRLNAATAARDRAISAEVLASTKAGEAANSAASANTDMLAAEASADKALTHEQAAAGSASDAHANKLLTDGAVSQINTFTSDLNRLKTAVGTSGKVRYDKALSALDVTSTTYDLEGNLTEVVYAGDDASTLYRDVMTYTAGALSKVSHYYGVPAGGAPSGVTALGYTNGSLSSTSYTEA